MIERLFGPSWRTSLAGYVIMICGSTGIADEISPFLPERVRYGMHALCLLSVTFGLTSARMPTSPIRRPVGRHRTKAIKP